MGVGGASYSKGTCVIASAALARDIAAASPGVAAEQEAELYRRFAPRIRFYGLRHLHDEEEAADLAQNVLMRIIESIRAGRVRQPDRLAAFILTTCRIVVLDFRRGEKRRRLLLEQFGADLAPDGRETRCEGDGQGLVEHMGRLVERERNVLVMTFYLERTTDQIAQDLDLSTGNVRIIRHRALAHLHDSMRERTSR